MPAETHHPANPHRPNERRQSRCAANIIARRKGRDPQRPLHQGPDQGRASV